MAVLAPDNIPLDLCFQVGATESEDLKDYNKFFTFLWQAAGVEDEMARLEVAEELGRFSLVTPVDDAHVNMHRLIQSVVQHQLLRRTHMPTAGR